MGACGQESHTAECRSHSAGIEYPSSRGSVFWSLVTYHSSLTLVGAPSRSRLRWAARIAAAISIGSAVAEEAPAFADSLIVGKIQLGDEHLFPAGARALQNFPKTVAGE